MRPLTLIIFCLIALCNSAFTASSTKNLSTSLALIKYGNLLKTKTFLTYPELRESPIKWFDSIPEGKIASALHPKEFNLLAQPGEFFTFQLGVWAMDKDVNDLHILFSNLQDQDGHKIETSRMTCFNLSGIDFKGKSFTKEVNIPARRVQPLWLGIDLEKITPGIYKGMVSVTSGLEQQNIPVLIKVGGEIVPNHGYDEGARLSRLEWLNSTVGINDEITKGYLPVKVEGKEINILGRTLIISESGLPESILTFFDPSNQSLQNYGEPILSHPFRFVIEKDNGEEIHLIPGNLVFGEQTPSKVVWSVKNSSDEVDLECSGEMEFDGFVDYKLTLSVKKQLKVKDIRLEIPVEKDKAEYMMGLGHEGGFRTPDWKWKWDVSKNQDMVWVGAVSGGLRVKWKAENYVRPLVNIYYEFGPLKLPPSWGNRGKGGITVADKDHEVVINAFSGSREMNPEQTLNYNFELLITPFRVIDRQNKFGDRYYHGGGTNTAVKVENAKKAGANIINIHHAEDIYPFINYPYLDANVEPLKELVANAHKENLRLKMYYTTRELTKNLPEFRAFNSLNGEVIFPGPGNASHTEALHPNGPNEWLIKNMRENYIPAWYNLVKEGKFKGETDLSVITTPDSRLNNFYIAGLDWMVQHIRIDGVYIDDAALDRFTLRRARKIIDQYRPEGRMDLHSWNHFNKWAGFTNCLNLYMDLLPYFDLVWIGEGRDYNRMPDHWLVEVSGIPFGLAGQMLEGGGNPWRGMVYGITNRAGWTGNSPSEMWKFWDAHQIKDKLMMGYWEKQFPVVSKNPMIKASIFKGKDEVILAVANWTETDQESVLSIDWKGLGFDPAKMELSIPEIAGFQAEQRAVALDKLTLPGKKGFLIVIKRIQ